MPVTGTKKIIIVKIVEKQQATRKVRLKT